MGGCCGAKPAPSPRGGGASVSTVSQQAAEQQAAEQQARVVALQAEKIKLLEEQVASLRQVNSASSSGSTASPAVGTAPPAASPAAATRTAPPIRPRAAPELRDAPPLPTERRRSRLQQRPTAEAEPEPEESPPAAQPSTPEGAGSEGDGKTSLLAAEDDAALTTDEQTALANIERLSFQMDPATVDSSSSSSVRSDEVSRESKLSTILSAGSQEQLSEPLSGSVWRGSYGSIGAPVEEQTQREQRGDKSGEPQRELQIEAVTVELDSATEDSAAEAARGTRRQQRRANANGFQMTVDVPDDDAEVGPMLDAEGEEGVRASVDSCSSAPGISPALSDGTMDNILAVAEESSQEEIAIQAAQEEEEEILLDELEASVVIEAESDMAVLAAAAEEARQAEEAVVAKRGAHSPISKSTSAKRQEIERMLAEANAEVSALKARRDGLLDEEETSAVLSHTPPRSGRAARAEWYSSDSASEDDVGHQQNDVVATSTHAMEFGEALEVEEGLEAAVLDLEAAAAAVVGSEDGQQEVNQRDFEGDNAELGEDAHQAPVGVELGYSTISEELNVDNDAPDPTSAATIPDESAVASDLPSDNQLLDEQQEDVCNDVQDDHEEQLRLARIQAREDRRLAKERQERAKDAAAEELELGALVANAEVADEEDPVAAAKRAKVLERMAKRSEERAEKLRIAKEERAARAAAAESAKSEPKKPKKKAKKKVASAPAKRNKAPKAKKLGPSGAEVDAAIEALQAGNRRSSAAVHGKGARPASGGAAAGAAVRRTVRSNRPASAGDAAAPAKKQAKVSTRPASGGGRGGGAVKTSKAVLAVQEMERKREARRAKALSEKNRRAAEIAEHGDVKNLHYRRQLDEFRQQLAAGKSGISLPKYRRKADSRVKVCVRKRPLLGAQQEDTAFDVLSTIGENTLLCHEPREGVDGRQTFEHHPFLFDAVFGDSDGGAEVYERAVGPEVEELLSPIFSSSVSGRGGGPSRLTVFAYGQTGSGKTYTMGALTEAVLGRLLDAATGVSATGRQARLGLSYYEIYMSKPYDLLNGRSACKTQEDGSGQCHITGLQELPLEIPLDGESEDDGQAAAAVAAAMELLEQGARSRTTAANGVHDASSRSHAIIKLRLRVSTAEGDQRQGKGLKGTEAIVSLVDLAGSERASETKQDDAATRLEGAEINKSLLALKECIRALDTAASHTPFRQSVLTQVLREGLEGVRSKTVMLATLSPAHRHAEHTLNTLRYAARLKELPQSAGGGRR